MRCGAGKTLRRTGRGQRVARGLGFAAALGLAFAVSFGLNAGAQEIYQTPGEFLAEALGQTIPRAQLLEISGEMRPDIARILGHRYSPDSVRYWRDGERTAWILSEIGKYRPITTGIVVSGGEIEAVRVLIYRESHGWEVHHDFFTDQFKGLTLDSRHRLSGRIDGISGATLSVNALRALARLALYFDQVVQVD